MHRILMSIATIFKKISKSTFYRRFLHEQGYVYRRPKILHALRRQALKVQSRWLNFILIQQILNSRQPLFLFDETTFNSEMRTRKKWYAPKESAIRIVKPPCAYLKLSGVISLGEIVTFNLCYESMSSSETANFILTTAQKIQKDRCSKDSVLILFDNAPKNRSKLLQELSDIGLIRPVYTTPTTPEQNFWECFFNVVKAKVAKLLFPDFLDEK